LGPGESRERELRRSSPRLMSRSRCSANWIKPQCGRDSAGRRMKRLRWGQWNTLRTVPMERRDKWSPEIRSTDCGKADPGGCWQRALEMKFYLHIRRFFHCAQFCAQSLSSSKWPRWTRSGLKPLSVLGKLGSYAAPRLMPKRCRMGVSSERRDLPFLSRRRVESIALRHSRRAID
jgi:hypothetical protein